MLLSIVVIALNIFILSILSLMACLIQKIVVNPRYKKIAPDNHFFMYHHEYGKIPKSDYYINVDCGRCINCIRKYMSSWRFRLIHEWLSLSDEAKKRSYYVTLTLSPKYYTINKVILKKYVRRFLERVRKKYKVSIRHFLVIERGEQTNRYHFHGFFFDTIVNPAEIYNFWTYGFVSVYPIGHNGKSASQEISYCTTYVTKGKKGKLDFVLEPDDVPFVLVSPGLGKSYINHPISSVHSNFVLNPMTYDINGKPRSLPRYLRQKVFDEKQLKLLKDDYFNNMSDDVVPDGPYYIGTERIDDYSVYLQRITNIKSIYSKIYGNK